MDIQDAMMFLAMTMPSWVVAVAAMITLLYTGA